MSRVSKRREMTMKQIREQQKGGFSRFIESIFDWAVHHKNYVFIGLGVIVAATVGTLVYVNNQRSNLEEALAIYDTAISTFENIMYYPEEERMDVYNSQIGSLMELVQLYPNTVPAVKARLFLGRAFFDQAYQMQDQNSINIALDHYTQAYEYASSDFFRALALIGMGQCYEQKNDFSSAFRQYETVIEKYKDAGFAPYALISMARCREMLNDPSGSLKFYERVAKEHTDSVWARYAKAKIYLEKGMKAPEGAIQLSPNDMFMDPSSGLMFR